MKKLNYLSLPPPPSPLCLSPSLSFFLPPSHLSLSLSFSLSLSLSFSLSFSVTVIYLSSINLQQPVYQYTCTSLSIDIFKYVNNYYINPPSLHVVDQDFRFFSVLFSTNLRLAPMFSNERFFYTLS